MTSGTGSRVIPTRTRTHAVHAQNRAVSMLTPFNTTRSNTVPRVATVAERVPEAGVTGVHEEETGRLRPRTVATAIILASPRGNAEARIHRRD